jgi:HEAT repeats
MLGTTALVVVFVAGVGAVVGWPAWFQAHWPVRVGVVLVALAVTKRERRWRIDGVPVGRAPGVSRVGSRLALRIGDPSLSALARARDVEGLLRRLDRPPEPHEDDARWRRATIAHLLGRLRAETAVDRLAKLLHRDEPDAVRRSAAGALGEIGGALAAQALSAALDDEAWQVREAAIAGLLQARDVAVWSKVAELAQADPVNFIRAQAAEALGQSEDDRWVPVLRSVAADDRRVHVRWAGESGLAAMRSSAADDALFEISRHGPRRVQRLRLRWSLFVSYRLRHRHRRVRASDGNFAPSRWP